jgi:uroporphyrinogen-III synthase
MRLLLTRPEPDATREAEMIEAHGHEAVLAPLLAIEFERGVPLELEGAQALLATSRNGLRALAAHPAREQAIKLPLLAVGDATASEAGAIGFADVTVGPGTGSKLAELIVNELSPEHGPLVHLAGEALAFDLKAALEAKGFTVRRPVLYRTVPATALPPKALSLLKARQLDGVMLMSPRTAKTFADLVGRHGLVTQAKSLVCYCLSEAVAEAVTPLGCNLRVAARPRKEDVLALLNSETASS